MTLHLLLQKRAVAGAADFEDARHIYRGKIDHRRSAHLRKNMPRAFVPAHSAINIERDGIHPGDHQLLVPKLREAFPAFGPRGLTDFARAFSWYTPRLQKPKGKIESALVCLAVAFLSHYHAVYAFALPEGRGIA